jgi:SAM-dependent methyltransferase
LSFVAFASEHSPLTRRPLYKRVGGRARDVLRRSLNLFDRAADPSGLPVPPAHLRAYYYRTRDFDAFVRARDAVGTEVLTHGLRPSDRVLDIGSGIGNLALALAGSHQGTYDGIEINPEAAGWCARAITPRHARFRFHHADVAGGAYNPSGRLTAAAYRFPFAEGSFDFVFLGSVFTHMLPADVAHYLSEIARVLAPGGTCAASLFLLNDERRASVAGGGAFMPFPFAIDSARLHDEGRPEAAVAIEESFVVEAYGQTGLRIERIRRGDWWNGRADDQDVITATR